MTSLKLRASSAMAFLSTQRCWFLIAALISIAVSCCKSELAGNDPSQLVARALECFNNDNIYSSCEETYRLQANGNINVPPEATDEYCDGPCLEETKLVLHCINGILTNFLFYNKATVQDISATLDAGCGQTSERGNFNVAEHIQDEHSSNAYSDRAHLMCVYLSLSMSMLTLFYFFF
ncbi:uncharacterized protein LOC122090784 [Macadamia integrifolia]|uniref:uncharacterized protein LOC122090784 n=1 Tax=Macadamia integrifolia TaxID=60698 RepID=UPI001C4FE762|nr:uncharacterized protein LOC122090784 [Macadamia integrifolia]